MNIKPRGPQSKPIRSLCSKYLLEKPNESDESKFKEGIRRVIQEGVRTYVVAQVLQSWANEYYKGNIDYIWKLADEADPEIRRSWERPLNTTWKL